MKRRAAKRTRLLVEELEPRILYSADAGVLAQPGALAPAAEVRVLDLRMVTPAAANTPATDAAATPPDPSATGGAAATSGPLSASDPNVNSQASVRHELVFVDTGVHDYRQLLDDLLANPNDGRQVDVILLDPNRDGVEQVTQALAAQAQPVDAMHFITHGTDGAIRLGDVWLSGQNVQAYAVNIAGWRQGLAADANLLLYGCDVADNADGRALVDTLHALTGANVAASSDVTGNAALGGNWNLEYTVGNVATSAVLTPAAGATWSGVLATLTVSTTADVVDGNTSSIAALLGAKGADGSISLREAIIAANNTAGADQIMLLAGTYMFSSAGNDDLSAVGDLDIRDALTITGAGSASTIVDGNALDRVFHVLNNSTATLTNLTIRNGAGNQGAGIEVTSGSTLNLRDVIVSGNSASSFGGGIQNSGTLTLTDVQITGNSAAGNAGGGLLNYGTATATRVTIDGNWSKLGGGVYNSGALTLTNVTISGNSAPFQTGGGVYNDVGGNLTATTVTIQKVRCAGTAKPAISE